MLVCLTSCGLLRRNGARTPARASASRTPPFGRRGIPREMADSRVLATARRIHIRLRVAVLRDSSHFRGFRPADGGEASRAWHPRELGQGDAYSSLPSGKSSTPPTRCIHRPQRDTSSAEYRLLVSLASGGASREPESRRSPALAPRTRRLAPTFYKARFLRSICACRCSIDSLNLARDRFAAFFEHVAVWRTYNNRRASRYGGFVI